MQLRRKLRWPAIWGGFVCQGNPLPIRGIVENSRIDLADYSVKQREVPAAPALIPVPLTSDTHEEMHAAQPLAHYSSQLQDDALRKAFALMNGSSPITPDEIRNTRRILYVLLREFRNLGCDDSEWAACAKVCIGITHCESGNHADALHYLNPGLSILRNARRPTDDTYLVGMLAWATACQALDQGAETIPVLESTIADAREAGCKSEPLQRLEAFLAAAYRKPLGISHTQANNSESKKGVS